MEARSRAQSAGWAFHDQIKAMVEASQASLPPMPQLTKPLDLQQLESKIDELHLQLEGLDPDDEDSEAQRQAKQETLVALSSELRPLKTDWDRTCRDAHVAYRSQDEMKANSLMNNILNCYKDFGPPLNGNMGVDTSALGLTGDSPADADPDTPRRPRMRMKRGGAVLTPDRNGVFESETRSKRKRAPSSAISHKRPRIQGNRNSIHFNAVYQNKRAAKKHTIIRVPENEDQDPVRPPKFYILRCENHDIDFNDNPLQSGLAHLSQAHQLENPSFETVVQLFGYELIGCDDEKLIQNNKVANEAFQKGQRGARDFIRVTDSPTPKTSRKNKNASNAAKKGRSSRKSRNTINPRDLVPGDVYIIYWSQSKQWYCGLLIPLQDPESVGIEESFEALGLLNNIPPCYEYDSSSKSFSWAEGYEDGGEDASDQHFPFMFFEGLDFPDLCHVAWIPLDEIQPWDEEKALMIEHSDQAFEYLKQREAAQRPKHLGPNDEISDSADDNSTSDLAPRSPVAESSTDFQPAQNAEAAVTPNTAPEADEADKAEDPDVTGQTDETLKDTEGAPEQEQDTQPELEKAQKVIEKSPEEEQTTQLEPEEAQSAQLETEESKDPELETEEVRDTLPEPEELQNETTLASGEVHADATLESGEVQKDTHMEVEDSQETRQEPEKVAEPPVQPDLVEDEDITMSSEESPPESAAQQATEDSEDIVMETPEDSTPEPLQQDGSQSDRDDQEIILDTQEDPAENVSSTKEPEEVTAEREEESSSHEAREERLPSVDLADLLTAGEDLEFQFSQSEQRELDQGPTPTPAHEIVNPPSAANDVVNTKQEESLSASPTPETASVARTENDYGDETREASQQPQRSSVATESSNDETPRPRLSYAEMGRASSLSEGVPSEVVESRPQIQPASRRARSGTPNRNALAAQSRMSSFSMSPVVSRPPAMSPPVTIPFSPTAPSASTPLQLPMMSQPPPSSQSSAIRSPTSQRPPSGLQHPVSSWPPDNSWASTTTQRLGPSQSSALARRPALSQSTAASQPPPSSQPPAARPSTLSRTSSLSQPSTSGQPFHAPIAQMGPASQVAMSPGPAVSNGEQPHNVRSTSQVLAPPRHSEVENLLPGDAQSRSEVLRHPHAAQHKASAQALGNAPRPKELPRAIKPKAPSKPSVEIVLLNRQAVDQARSQSMTTGQQAVATSPTQMPAAHERHSEPAQTTPTPPVTSATRPIAPAPRRPLPQERPSPRPSASPVKRREAPKDLLPQKQAPRLSSQPPSGAENTLAAQPPASYTSRPASPAHQNSPRLPPMNVPPEGHYIPNTMLAQQQASLSRPGSSGHVGPQPMPSPRLAAGSISRPGSASQMHIRSQAMPSPHQLAAEVQRPQSSFQGHPGSQPMYSPRHVPGEIPHHNHRPVPSPRRPYAVPVQPPPSPHQPFSHFPHRSPEMQGNGYVSQRHASTGTLSPQSSTAENQLPPIRLPNISRPRSEAHAGSNMISPPQTAVGARPGHYTGHQQPTPPIMQSPRLSAAEISRPHTASNMRPPLATMSPVIGHIEPRRPNSSYSQTMPFHAPLPTMQPNYSGTGYQSSAPSAHQYAQPNRPQGHLRRHSESACQPQLQQYALAGSPQIANSTPRSYQSHELDQGTRRNPALDPFVSELSPSVRKALLEQVGAERPDLVPCDFLNTENRYRCPFCKESTLEPLALINHIKMSCPMLEEKYKQDKIEQGFEANRGKRVKPAKRKSQMAQAAKNARLRS